MYRHEDSDLESTGTESVEDEDSEENVSETETDHDKALDEGESSSDLEDSGTYQDWLKEATDMTEEIRNEK